MKNSFKHGLDGLNDAFNLFHEKLSMEQKRLRVETWGRWLDLTEEIEAFLHEEEARRSRDPDWTGYDEDY